MEYKRATKLAKEFIEKTNNTCLNCTRSFNPFKFESGNLVFECKCGLKIVLEDK